MSILGRYLAGTVIKATLLVLLIFIGLEIFILLATQLNSLGKGSYNIWQAMIYVLLTLPKQTYLLFPMAALIGMLFGLSLLANHSELIIMGSSGVSHYQIMMHTLKAGLILILLMTLVGEFVAPHATHIAEKRKLLATSSGQAIQTKRGLWLRQGNSFCYIKNILSAHHIANISCYAFNDQQQLLTASFAKSAVYKNHLWHVSQLVQSQFVNHSVNIKNTPQTTWNLTIDPRLLRISLSEPDEMTLPQLYDYIAFQKASHLAPTSLEISFWQRVLQPLASLVMMFLAIPFVFGSLRVMTTGLRLLMGVILGFGFYMCNQLFPPLSQVLNFPPFIAVLLPIVLFISFGMYLFKRTG